MSRRTLRTVALVLLTVAGWTSVSLNRAEAALVAHYKLDEAVAGPVVNEVGPDGTNFGATINQPGQIDQAYSFNGTSQYATIPSPAVGAGSFSAAAWINVANFVGTDPTWGMGIVRSTPGDPAIGDFFLSVDNVGRLHFTNWRVVAADPTGVHFTAPGLITAGSWMHVAGTWDGLLSRMYINGALVAEAGTETTGGGWGTESSIGRDFASPTYHFDGLIDDVGIWTETLSAAKINSIYENGLLGFDLSESNPVPEPSTFVLAGLGCVGIVLRARRRRTS